MTNRMTQKRRLEKAGYECLNDLWVPAPYAARVKAQAETYRAEVRAILDAPAAPRGRPRKA